MIDIQQFNFLSLFPSVMRIAVLKVVSLFNLQKNYYDAKVEFSRRISVQTQGDSVNHNIIAYRQNTLLT